MAQEATIPAGKAKGTPLSQADEKDIRYWHDRIGKSLEAEPNKQYADRDRAWVHHAAAELQRRKAGGAVAAPATPQAMPGTMPAGSGAMVRQGASSALSVAGSYRDAHKADQVMTEMAARAHLVSPAPTCGNLPEGCSLVLSTVLIDAENETYNIPGGDKKGLARVALDKIFGAVGGSWDARETRRLDSGRDPHYCHYKAVGRIRDFDGAIRILTGEVEIDMRDGGAEVESIRAREARKRAKDGAAYYGDDGRGEIAQIRKFILRHAESKAKNRAVRSIGIRPAYSKAELAKPFVAARVQFTGATNDPMLKALFAAKTADAFLGGAGALYGGDPPPPALTAGHTPPPVGSVPADDEAIEADYYYEPGPSTPAWGSRAPQTAAATPPQAAPESEGPTDEDRATFDAIDRGDNAEAY